MTNILKPGSPEEAGLNPQALEELDGEICASLGTGPERGFPGAVLLVARRGVVAKHVAYGYSQTHGGERGLKTPRPMRPDTIFDLASVTKVAATTAAIMRLVEDGRVDIEAPVSDLIPEFSGGGKERVTVRHLLEHRAGLWEWWPLYLHARGREEVIQHIARMDLRYPVGEERHYSDLGFILLGEVVSRVSGEPLDRYVRREIHIPLGMKDTSYLPPVELRERIAATSHGDPYEQRMIRESDPYPVEADPDRFDGWRGYTIVGEVHDGNAFHALGGVSGHAGLFSTAYDLAVFGQVLLNGGSYGEFRLCSPETIKEFTRDRRGEGQGLGFRVWRMETFVGRQVEGFGHPGFTGTRFIVVPELEMAVVLLTNRVHPGLPYGEVEPAWQAVLRGVAVVAESS
jgi:CubicO group peptidase (beta-lactamase class C family)